MRACVRACVSNRGAAANFYFFVSWRVPLLVVLRQQLRGRTRLGAEVWNLRLLETQRHAIHHFLAAFHAYLMHQVPCMRVWLCASVCLLTAQLTQWGAACDGMPFFFCFRLFVLGVQVTQVHWQPFLDDLSTHPRTVTQVQEAIAANARLLHKQ